MFEICDYDKKKGLLGVIDYRSNNVEYHNEKELRQFCKMNNIVIGGLFRNGLTIYPVSFSFDDESHEASYNVLSLSKGLLDFLKSNKISYNSSLQLSIDVTKSIFSNSVKAYIVINNSRCIEITDEFARKCYNEIGVDLGEYCISLVGHYRHPYFQKYYFQ